MLTKVPVPRWPRDSIALKLDLVAPTATAMQRHILRRGFAGFQRSTTRTLLALWETSSRPVTFFDVGANSALYAALCKKLHPSARVVAFEPLPTTAAVAREVMVRNHVEVTIEEQAVSSATGNATLHLSSRSDASHSLVEEFKPSDGTLEVPTITIDDYVERSGIAPTVVKVDVEFHEAQVLRGAQQTMRLHRPAIIAEVIRKHRRDQGDEIAAILRRHGYAAYRLTDPADWRARTEINGKGKQQGRDWLFVPGELPLGLPELVARWDESLERWCRPRLPQRAAWHATRYLSKRGEEGAATRR